jgi:hypothetical protein
VTQQGEGDPLSLTEGASPAGKCRIDLRAALLVEPLELVEIAARAEYHRRRGDYVEFLAPDDTAVANYLARMRLGWALTELGVDHDLPYVPERDLAGQLLELTYFEGADRSDELAEMVYSRVAAESPPSAAALYTSLCEVGQNVPEHADVAGGWAAAQATLRQGAMRFAVADSGIGMRRSLARRWRWRWTAGCPALRRPATATGSSRRAGWSPPARAGYRWCPEPRRARSAGPGGGPPNAWSPFRARCSRARFPIAPEGVGEPTDLASGPIL